MPALTARIVNQAEGLFAVDSATGEGSYRVNLKQGSCTCPHFAKRLSGLPIGDPARVCKHQVAAAAQQPFLIAAAKAKMLSDALLVELLAKHAANPLVSGVLRCERHRRRQAAAADAHARAIFS